VTPHHLSDFCAEVVEKRFVEQATFENPHDVNGAVTGRFNVAEHGGGSARGREVGIQSICRLSPRFIRKRQVFPTVLSARVVPARRGWGCRPQSRRGFAEGLFVA
jgi:hypothetical protein